MKIYYQLNGLYPDPPIPLDHETPFQLLVAVVLSAQVRSPGLRAKLSYLHVSMRVCKAYREQVHQTSC